VSEVSFDSGGTRCVGIHLAGLSDAFVGEDGLRPCVVLAHGFGGTVDSGLVPYAERFAGAGLDALAFDYRHFGASDGEPRQLISIREQLDDYAAAIAFARSLPGVDPERIAVWGSSYSGGHVVAVAVADCRVAAAIAQTPAMDGATAVLNIARYAGPGQLLRMIAAGIRDQAAALRGEEPVTIAVVGPRGSLAAMTTPDAQPGYEAIAGPSWRNEVAARIMLRAGSYRPGLQADRLPCPILVQVADHDSVAPVKAAQDAVWRATGRGEMRTYPIGHFDIYVGEPFERAIADQLHFLRRHLDPGARAGYDGDRVTAAASAGAA
jgi:pimeloyl-ACP methyl ester carboxylesterase